MTKPDTAANKVGIGAVVQLDWSNKNGTVTVTPESQDRFVIKVERAMEACSLAVEEDKFRRQFDLLLKRLATWLSDQKTVERSYVTLRDGGLLFVAVRSVATYDAAFSDSLSALDLSIANDPDLDLIRLDTLALPPVSDASLASFLDRSMTMKYRGKRS